MSKTIGVGLVGFGTVGAGVVDGLQRNRGKISERLDVEVELRRIVDLDITTDRGVTLDPSLLTTDVSQVLGNPDIDIVVELVGGTGFAKEVVTRALQAGQSVVTANKKLLAEYGRELFPLAEKMGVDLYFGASVGGAIPIIRALREGLAGNKVESILGIVNGTCNYILSRMESEGTSFEVALEAAQKAGYAEADPTLDVDGFDTLHKASILAALAYGIQPDTAELPVSGIRGTIEARDFAYARELGYCIKLLGIVRGDESEVEVRVAPTLVARGNMLASVNGVFNAVMVKSDLADRTLYYGRGAGRLPTASTVISDIADVAFNRLHGSPLKVIIAKHATPVKLRAFADVQCSHYVRLDVQDRVGAMASIMAIFAAHNVSIASMLQKETAATQTEGTVPVVILTHAARMGDIEAALSEIACLDVVSGKPVRLGMEGE